MKKLFILLMLLLLPLTAYSAATDYYVTTTGAGAKDGLTWAKAFSLTEYETDVEGFAEPGDRYFFEGGTPYTQTSDIATARDGIATANIKVIGVKAGTTNEPPITSDWAIAEADRPSITGNNVSNTFDNYWELRNMDYLYTGTGSGAAVRIDQYGLVENSKAVSTSTHASSMGLNNAGVFTRMVNSEFSSTSGVGIFVNADDTIEGCYIHDSVTLVKFSGGGNSVLNSILDTGTTFGIDMVANTGNKVIGNTIYDATTGIAGTTSHANLILGNIIDTCTTKGINFTTTSVTNYLDYNNFNGNTGGDVSGVTKGNNATAVVPDFTNAPGGDFSIGAAMSSGGFPGEFPGGLSEGFKEQGAVQRASSVAVVAPTFAGITALRIVGSTLRAYWSAGTGTITTYDVFIQATTATGLFSAANRIKVENTLTSYSIKTLADGVTFLDPTTTYYVGVRATNIDSSDTNTVSYFSIPYNVTEIEVGSSGPILP